MANADGTTGDEPRLGGQSDEETLAPGISIENRMHKFLLSAGTPAMQDLRLQEVAAVAGPHVLSGVKPETMVKFLGGIGAVIDTRTDQMEVATTVVTNIALSRQDSSVYQAIAGVLQNRPEFSVAVIDRMRSDLVRPAVAGETPTMHHAHQKTTFAAIVELGRRVRDDEQRTRILDIMIRDTRYAARVDFELWMDAMRLVAQKANNQARANTIRELYERSGGVISRARASSRGRTRGRGSAGRGWAEAMDKKVKDHVIAIAGKNAHDAFIWQVLPKNVQSAITSQEKKEAQK